MYYLLVWLNIDPDKPFAERHNTPTNIICVLNLAFEATEAMVCNRILYEI